MKGDDVQQVPFTSIERRDHDGMVESVDWEDVRRSYES